MSYIKEITYINEGEIYRESELPMTGSSRIHNSHFIGSRTDETGKQIISNYYNLSYPVPQKQYNWISRKTYNDNDEAKIKKYYKSEWFATQAGETDWLDVPEGIDVCPNIGNIVCIGIMDNEIDLFFDISDADHMQEVADYYKLSTPLKYDEAFTGGQHKWSYFNLTPNDVILRNIKMGAIKFIDNIPIFFKYYKYVSC